MIDHFKECFHLIGKGDTEKLIQYIKANPSIIEEDNQSEKNHLLTGAIAHCLDDMVMEMVKLGFIIHVDIIMHTFMTYHLFDSMLIHTGKKDNSFDKIVVIKEFLLSHVNLDTLEKTKILIESICKQRPEQIAQKSLDDINDRIAILAEKEYLQNTFKTNSIIHKGKKI